MSIAAIAIFTVEYISCGDVSKLVRRILKFRPKVPNSVKPHIRRIQKLEKDGQQAIAALKNLSETKRKINEDYRNDWDNQYRLLLPPPETPNRQALKFNYYTNPNACDQPKWFGSKHVLVDSSLRPVPVGYIRRDGTSWFVFDNLPGHEHKIMFIRTIEFEDVESDKFWAFLPTVRESNGTYVWDNKKAKVLASNLIEGVMDRISG
jgi:hypothetical protein